MANKTITELTAADPLTGTELTVITQGGNSRKVATQDIADLAAGGVYVGTTPPPSPEDNTLWWDSETGALRIRYNDGTSAQWVEISPESARADPALEWTANFTGDADLYIPADAAMTIIQGNAQIGTGTISYEKSTAASPAVFASATLPVTLEAGAWLKVIATGVTDFVATHLKEQK